MDVDFEELDKAIVGVMDRIREVSRDDILERDRESFGEVLMNLNSARVQISRACNRVQIRARA